MGGRISMGMSVRQEPTSPWALKGSRCFQAAPPSTPPPPLIFILDLGEQGRKN